MSNEDYDAVADFAGSLDECYRAIRARVAAGGPSWVPRPPEDSMKKEIMKASNKGEMKMGLDMRNGVFDD